MTGTRLKGKRALITAAGQGIGKACALAMAAEGAQVLATDVNGQLLQAYAGVAGVRTQVLDVLDKNAIQAAEFSTRNDAAVPSSFARRPRFGEKPTIAVK